MIKTKTVFARDSEAFCKAVLKTYKDIQDKYPDCDFPQTSSEDLGIITLSNDPEDVLFYEVIVFEMRDEDEEL